MRLSTKYYHIIGIVSYASPVTVNRATFLSPVIRHCCVRRADPVDKPIEMYLDLADSKQFFSCLVMSACGQFLKTRVSARNEGVS
jgi:hypothetical protein